MLEERVRLESLVANALRIAKVSGGVISKEVFMDIGRRKANYVKKTGDEMVAKRLVKTRSVPHDVNAYQILKEGAKRCEALGSYESGRMKVSADRIERRVALSRLIYECQLAGIAYDDKDVNREDVSEAFYTGLELKGDMGGDELKSSRFLGMIVNRETETIYMFYPLLCNGMHKRGELRAREYLLNKFRAKRTVNILFTRKKEEIETFISQEAWENDAGFGTRFIDATFWIVTDYRELMELLEKKNGEKLVKFANEKGFKTIYNAVPLSVEVIKKLKEGPLECVACQEEYVNCLKTMSKNTRFVFAKTDNLLGKDVREL
ncbi:hypothetical protein SAMN02910417_01073 [Eubacterium oxidoreducens]|uniref:Uncharacterized protein n=2 Tax=Eubacterium oxidoreducens TaxID=1732 RepID=A0A1G6B240_EUBOX|nr:hypothetical protein SAMN02910417_01073 [Eubacterium oxidoreducens]